MKNFVDNDFSSKFYGVIDKIIGEEIHARIYQISDHEFVDEITFNIDEFSKEDRIRITLNVVFLWNIGCRQNKHYSTFKIKRISED